jgi:DNA-binding CsgD family transcriptional regulator
VLRAVRSALDDAVARAEIAAELSVSLAMRRPGEAGAALLEESLREVPDREPGVRLNLRAHLEGVAISGLERLPADVPPDPDEEIDTGSLAGRMLLRGSAILHAFGLGRIDRAPPLVERADCSPTTVEADTLAGHLPALALMALTLADRPHPEEGALFELMIAASERRGTSPGVAAGHGVRGFVRYAAGDLRDARADSEIAVQILQPTGVRVLLGNWLGSALRVLVALGETTAAEALLDDVWRGREPGPGIPGAVFLISRGELRYARGRHAEARHDFLAASERVRWVPYPNPEVLGWRTGLALAEAALGNDEEARRLAGEAVGLAREAGGTRGIGIALRVQGAVTEGNGGIELLGEAAEILAGTRARLQHAHALADLGAALRRANRRKDAREPLREALDLAHRSGAAPLEERARSELEATGARPRKAVLSGVESLTPSELRVARLAGEGKTNREIAQTLFVTPKTVETHLRHVYQKLGVDRPGLADALANGE